MAALVSLDTIKAWLGIVGSDYDSTLELLRDAVEASVLQYCETSFSLETVEKEIIDGTESDTIVPAHFPISSVQAVRFGVNTDGTGGSTISSTNYQVKQDAIILKGIVTPKGRANISIDYKYGYDGLPSDVKLAIIQAVEAEYRRKSKKSIGVASRSKDGESETYKNDVGAWDSKTGLPKEVVYKLQPYKTFEFPTQPMATRNE
jgi:hypothetical protein